MPYGQTSCAVLPFWPKHRLGHPENYLFSLSKEIYSGSKYYTNVVYHFEKGSNDLYIYSCNSVHVCDMLVSLINSICLAECRCVAFSWHMGGMNRF